MTEPTPDDPIRTLIDRVTAQARAEATDEHGRVDALKEAVAFRRLIVEAALESGEPSAD